MICITKNTILRSNIQRMFDLLVSTSSLVGGGPEGPPSLHGEAAYVPSNLLRQGILADIHDLH